MLRRGSLKVFECGRLISVVNKQAITSFLKPSLVVVIIVGIFVPVMFVGLADRYAFTCGGDGHKCEGMDIQKPYLYGIPCGCWLVWILSSAPLLMIEYSFFSNPAGAAVDSIIWETAAVGSISVIAFTTNIVYYYLAACFVAFIFRKIRNKPSAQGLEHIKS